MEDKENNYKDNEIQSLYIDYVGEKKEEETFESKMDSLFNQLDEQFEKVKKYSNFDIPLDQIELNQYKFKYNFQNDNGNNIINDKENLIEFNINNENKGNNDNQDEIILKNKNKKVEIKEIKDDEEMKKKMYDEMAYQRMEEERKIKEMELEKKREQNLEEEKRIKEEQKKREEALIEREKEILKREEDLLKKEKDLEIKRKEEEKRILEEKRRIEEEEEAVERSRMLKEEEEKLRKIEEEKEKEEKRESDRIKMLRIQKEKEEEEEKRRKKLEDEKNKELEKQKKEKEIIEEKKLIDQINNNKMNNNKAKKSVEETNNEINEIDIEEINSDEDIEELEVNDNNNKQSNNKNTVKSVIKSTNSEFTNNTKLKSINKGNLTNSRFNNKSINNFNKSRNKNISPTKKSQIKESTNKNMKKPKDDKKPEDNLFKEKAQDKNRDDSEFVQKFKKSKVFSQISQEIIDKLLEHIYAIDDFEEINSEIDDINIYPSITEFNKEEKKLKEIIPEFEKTILKNDKLKVDDRYRKYYSEEEAFDKNQENDKVNELLFEIMNISNESHMDILQKNFEKEKLKNLPTTEFEELNDIEELENKLFGKEDTYPESYPIISNLENLRTFIYKFKSTAKENSNIMVNAIKSFNYWRSSLNDGNSFYRVIMFSLIEHCILNKDNQFLMILLNEISSDDFIEYYKKRKIEYNKPFMILSAITIMLENKLEVKALEYLLKDVLICY